MLKNCIRFLDNKLGSFEFSNLGNLRVVSPRKRLEYFLAKRASSPPRNIAIFPKKCDQKTNDLILKKPLRAFNQELPI